jgi:hypothetical protein
MAIKPFSLMMLARLNSSLQAARGKILTPVFILFPVCFLLTACGFLSSTFRSADCDIIHKGEEGSPVAGRAAVSGIVGKGEPIKGTGWFVREQDSRGTYFIQFDPPFSATPGCCVETQQSSLSKLSVEVVPSVSGLHLVGTHGSERCLRMEKRVEYGYVIEEKCVEWQTFQLPWDGRLKFTCVSQ